MSNPVKLTYSEMVIGAHVGVLRQSHSAFKENAKTGHGLDPTISGLSLHVESASAEMAVAKFLNTYWSCHVANHNGPDVGVRTQVRHTMKVWPKLTVRTDDKDDDLFVLVTGTSPNFFVRGWIIGKAARQDVWWGNPQGREPAWFVPVEHLNSMDSFPKDF